MPDLDPANPGKNVVLFDGVCNLCNGAINTLIDLDEKGRLHYASLQSEFGEAVLDHFGLPKDDYGSFIFLRHDGAIYQKSRGALEVLRMLGSAWKLLYVFVVIPPFLRDGIYNLIARNRYKWFGKRDSCRMPTPELKSRFV